MYARSFQVLDKMVRRRSKLGTEANLAKKLTYAFKTRVTCDIFHPLNLKGDF